jgi:fructokinase
MKDKTFDLVTLGEMLIDMFPDLPGRPLAEVEAFHPKPGGAPANVAVAARRLGLRSAFIGKVGSDHFGRFLQGVLDAEGVDTRGMRFDPEARTTLALIALPDVNSPEFIFYRNPGADQRLREEELDIDLLGCTKALHIGSLSLTDEPARSATFRAVKEAKRFGALVSYDVNYRPSLWKDEEQALLQARSMLGEVDLVKLNEGEAALLTDQGDLDPTDISQVERAARALTEQGPELVAITLGAAGSYFQTREGGAYVPGFQVKTLDAVGCGDAFTAGLLSRLITRQKWTESLQLDILEGNFRFANAVGALTSLKRGAIPAMPYRSEVEGFLKERGFKR